MVLEIYLDFLFMKLSMQGLPPSYNPQWVPEDVLSFFVVAKVGETKPLSQRKIIITCVMSTYSNTLNYT